VTTRSRYRGFGSAALLVVAGVVAAIVIAGETGQLVGFALAGLGLVLATSLVFLEVGLSEDRDRARQRKRATRSSRPRTRASRPGRSRDHRRRL
jgi:hypothetical protein